MLIYLFSSWMFRFFLGTRWRQFREGSVVCCQLYRIHRMAIVRCRFVFLGIDWFRFFYCYLHFDCCLHFLTEVAVNYRYLEVSMSSEKGYCHRRCSLGFILIGKRCRDNWLKALPFDFFLRTLKMTMTTMPFQRYDVIILRKPWNLLDALSLITISVNMRCLLRLYNKVAVWVDQTSGTLCDDSTTPICTEYICYTAQWLSFVRLGPVVNGIK